MVFECVAVIAVTAETVNPFQKLIQASLRAVVPAPFVSSAKQVYDDGREGGGGGGEGNGAPVCTHTFADTPDGGWHEPPIINSDLRLWCPGITRKGLSQWQCWPDQELEWTANESELPQPEFELS